MSTSNWRRVNEGVLHVIWIMLVINLIYSGNMYTLPSVCEVTRKHSRWHSHSRRHDPKNASLTPDWICNLDSISSQKQGRSIERVLGDGNCLFRALSLQLTGMQDHHLSLRKIIAQCESKATSFQGIHAALNKTITFADHVKNIAKTCAVGDHSLEIIAVASIFQSCIQHIHIYCTCCMSQHDSTCYCSGKLCQLSFF